MARGKEGNENHNGANIGFEQTLWLAADKLRGGLDAAKYKHVLLGLIFLKYVSDAFQERFNQLKSEPPAEPEDPFQLRAGTSSDCRRGIMKDPPFDPRSEEAKNRDTSWMRYTLSQSA